MKPIIAVISPGNMGAGIGGRLAERGAEIRTWLSGRSAASAERARRAEMAASDESGIAEAQFILSIVPPGDALALAERLAPTLRSAAGKPVYMDCNAVNPETAARIAAVIAAAGCAFIDGGIIGGPPTPGGKGPALYVSGPEAARATALIAHGLDIRVLEGPVGAASALKMSYAGITKGFTALGAAMALAATRAGAAEALHRELADSQPALLGWLTRQVPRMYPKAYRWVAEMEEIAGFIGAPDAGAPMLDGAARLYQRIANDAEGEQHDTSALSAFYRDTK
jgi:L-threonate 2-dehydrogenase